MYTTLLQLTNCQTILRAAAAAKRTESQNHQSMYDCSFPTFSFYVVSEPSYCHVATRSSGTITFVFFFFLKDQLEDPSKTIHQLKPTREKSASPDANPVPVSNCKERGSQSTAWVFGFLPHERQEALPGLTSTPGYMDLRKHRLLGSKAFEITPV